MRRCEKELEKKKEDPYRACIYCIEDLVEIPTIITKDEKETGLADRDENNVLMKNKEAFDTKTRRHQFSSPASKSNHIKIFEVLSKRIVSV